MAAKDLGFDQRCYERALSELRYADSTPECSPSSPGAGSDGSDSAGGGWPGVSGAGGCAPVAGPHRQGLRGVGSGGVRGCGGHACGYGVARGARIINYALGMTGDGDRPADCAGVDVEDAIGAAVADGVRVVSISLSSDVWVDNAAREAVAMAVAHGVVAVVATGNDGAVDPPDSYASMNGTVGAGASDGQGRIKDYSNRGRGLTVLAPGDIRWHNLTARWIEKATGTSFAAPVVAGLVAVAMGEWPGATSNQVLQALVANATAGPTGQPLVSPGV